jgi:hypothetical protein
VTKTPKNQTTETPSLDDRIPVRFVRSSLSRIADVSPSAASFKFSRTLPKTARDIKARLSVFGARGKKRSALTNAILCGKKHIAHVEAELYVMGLINVGFAPLPPERSGNTMVLRLIRRLNPDAPEEEVMVVFRKANTSEMT